MKNSKWMRFLLIVVSVAMVLSLFACGDKGGNEGETTTAAPEGTTAAPENTTVAGGETTTVAGGETTTVAGGEDTTVAGGEDTTVAGGEDTTVAGGEDTTVAGGEDTTVAGGEDTTVAPEPVYEGNWHCSVDAFVADMDGNLGAYETGNYDAIDTLIAAASTCKANGITILDSAGTAYSSVNANYVWFAAGWIAVDGHDVANFACNVYDAEGNLLKTVALGLNPAEEGVVNHVANNMGYAEGTVSYRVKFDAAELVNLMPYAGQTVTVVYTVDVVGTEFTIDLVELEVEVPALPEGYISGSVLAGLANPDHLDSTVDDDGYVTFTGKTGDNNIMLNSVVTGTPKYAVMKYKTTTAGAHATVYATTTSGSIGGNVKVGLTADGEWHIIAFALENSADYTIADGEAVTFLRLDVCETAPGTETITIAYLQFCDSLEGINVDKNFQKCVDGEGIDGVNYTFGGWAGVDGYTLSGVTLYITDANGNVTPVALENTDDESVALRWHERSDITTHLINNSGFAANTLGYAIRISGSLEGWAEQTVTLTIKVTVSDGTVITVHESTQTVGAAPVEDNTNAPEDNTNAPEDNTNAPEDNTNAPEDNTNAPEDSTNAPADDVTVENIVLSVDTLALPEQAYSAGKATVGGVEFEYIQLGNYGDGIQMRDKNGNTSSVWNTAAFAAGIARIELVYSDSKDVTYANADAVIFTFGNEVKGATYTTKLSTTAGEKTYTITPDAETYTFLTIEHDLGYSMYWKSITIVFADGTTATID